MILFFLFLTAIVTSLLGFYLWQSSSSRDLIIFSLFTFTVALWSFCVGFESLAQSLQGKLFFSKLQYLGIAPLPVLWLVFTLSYTGRAHWTNLKRIFPLFFVPALTLLIALTNDSHGLLYRSARLEQTPFGTDLVVERGAWFWAGHMTYSYSLLLAGVLVLLFSYRHAPKLYRRQYQSLLLASSFPIFANLLFLGGADLLRGVDPTPLSFGLSCAVIAPALLRYHLFDLMPIAQRTVFETLPVAIVVLDPRNRVIDINPEGQRLLGQSADTVVGVNITTLMPQWSQLRDKLANTPNLSQELSLDLSGQTVELDVTIVALENTRKQLAGYVLMARDISAQKAYETLALHDPLTELPNRRFLELEAKTVLREAKREGWQVALLYLDLDKFKPVNDRFGHDVGDTLLKHVGKRIQAVSRDTDCLTRFGGDEFVILTRQVTKDEAQEIASRIVAALHKPFNVDGHNVMIGGSIGIAFYPKDADSLDNLIQNADTAMYAAKIADIGIRFYEANKPL